MKLCNRCGSQVEDSRNICPFCGNNLMGNAENKTQQSTLNVSDDLTSTDDYKDNGSGWWAVLGFFFPVVGLILYLVWKYQYPRNAKKCLTGFIISLVASVVLILIYVVCIVAVMIGLLGGM